MRRIVVAALLVFSAAAAAPAAAPIYDAVSLNIGLTCQWQERCIARQQRAMKRALKYVDKYDPPAWRIQLCNRNASRKRNRVDWVGFENCVRNAALRPAPPRNPVKRRARYAG